MRIEFDLTEDDLRAFHAITVRPPVRGRKDVHRCPVGIFWLGLGGLIAFMFWVFPTTAGDGPHTPAPTRPHLLGTAGRLWDGSLHSGVLAAYPRNRRRARKLLQGCDGTHRRLILSSEHLEICTPTATLTQAWRGIRALRRRPRISGDTSINSAIPVPKRAFPNPPPPPRRSSPGPAVPPGGPGRCRFAPGIIAHHVAAYPRG